MLEPPRSRLSLVLPPRRATDDAALSAPVGGISVRTLVRCMRRGVQGRRRWELLG
jgi:hypothetical protein